MTRHQELAESKEEPQAPADDDLPNELAIHERRRGLEKFAAGFGAIGFFGVVDFIAALVRGTVGPSRIAALLIAVWFCITAIWGWRESREKPDETIPDHTARRGDDRSEGLPSAHPGQPDDPRRLGDRQ